jgi:hypothetical protein
MTDSSPSLPVLQRIERKGALFSKLSEFQVKACAHPPIPPQLPEVLRAAAPALHAGFAYSASHWGGELTVTIHFGSAELGSSAPVSPSSYSSTCALLLAGLLGIPVADGDHASEPEPEPPTACGLRPVPDPVEPEPVAACGLKSAADPTPQEDAPQAAEPVEPGPAADTQRLLSEEEKAAAIEMIKAMPTEQRKAFTKAFREVFAVPAEAKQVVPFIAELQHLHFIDRYTVEATGGVAA